MISGRWLFIFFNSIRRNIRHLDIEEAAANCFVGAQPWRLSAIGGSDFKATERFKILSKVDT